jgi:flagellar biosynthesis component FlhA
VILYYNLSEGVRFLKCTFLFFSFFFFFVYIKAQKSEAAQKKHEKQEADVEAETDKEVSADVMWINAMIGRVLFDILKNQCLVEKLQERLQRKLSTIKVCKI